ncbi:hypothetical protein MLD38_014101 [Melastoma candidum]|uniref:Uncharacterized protein n=1 Tax=Melastoma candidum TaxID=119954 RepID=A0ACB9RFD9_9MYRT|nr:hypothetical protein MLD38_014101 [Melastoma candidum]
MGQERREEERRVDFPGPIVIGAGPSGLAVAACRSQHGVPSLVLERLPLATRPTIGLNYTCRSTSASSPSWVSPRFPETKECVYASRWVIVATGDNAEPVVPDIPWLEKFREQIVHTSGYKSGSGFRNKRVLVVGCGNSRMEVSLDLCQHNAMPHMVVRDTVHVLPREMFGLSTFGVAMGLLRWLPLKWVDRLLLLVADFKFGDTGHLGLRRPKTGPIELKRVTGRTPVLDVGGLSLVKSGSIKVTRGVKEVTGTGARFVDGQERECDSIILATEYKSNVAAWLKAK